MVEEEKSEEQKIEEAKKISVKEACGYSVMDGFGLRYITPFANAIGATNTHIGFLTSIPSLLGNLVQLLTPKAMEKYSRKKLVFWPVLLQSFMWLAMVFLAVAYFVLDLNKQKAPIFLITIYTIMTIFGAYAGPAWSSWMKDLVTKDKGSYFGRRSRISGALALILMFIAGFILDYFKQTKIFIGFTILFSLAFLGRFISAMLFTKQYDPRLELKEGYYFSFWQFIKKMPYNNYGRFSIFLALLNIAVSISSPFFAIYLLEDLKLKSMQFGYIFYTIICMSASITTLLVMASWGKFADKYGNYRVMKITSYFIPLIPLYWVCSSFLIGKISIIWMTVFFVIFEGISGVIWAGFNLSSSNYIYDAVTKERMALCVAYLNVLSGFGVFIGAVFGGYISSLKFSFFGLSPILFIFLLSALARFFVVFFMVPRIKEVRDGVINLDIKDKIKKDIKEEIEVASKSLKKFHAIDFILGLHNRFGRQKFVE